MVAKDSTQMILVEDISKVGEFQKSIGKAKQFVLDIETTGLDPIVDTVLLIQIKSGEDIFVLDARKIEPRIITYYLELLSGCGKTVIGHNLKFDYKFIYQNYGVIFKHNFDTMLAEVLINNGIGSKFYSIKDVVAKYCNVELDKSERESFYNYMGEVTQQQLIYAVEDVMYLESVSEQQNAKLVEQKQERVLDLEMSVIPVFVSMELNGIRLNVEKWEKLNKLAQEQAEQLELDLLKYVLDNIFLPKKYKNLLEFALAVKIPVKTKKLTKELEELPVCIETRSWAEKNLNLGSPLQLKTVLELLGVVVKNTNEKTLKEIKGSEVISKILSYREMSKKVSAFGSTITNKIHTKTQRIHPDLIQIGSDSGRVASHNPNMLQIPRESDYRSCFEPESDWLFVDIDFSQEELRLFGAVSKEPKFIEAYRNKTDLHKLTGSIIFNKKIEDVTKEERQIAKSVNFASVYGSTEYGLAYNFGFPLEQAEEIIKNFWKGYDTANKFRGLVSKKIIELGFSTTLLGRKRYYEKKSTFVDSKEASKYYNQVVRELTNHIIQGTGTEILKGSLKRIFYEQPFGDSFKIILVVHDEILFEVRKEIAEEALKFCSKIMEEEEQKYLGEIPAEVEGKISLVWEH